MTVTTLRAPLPAYDLDDGWHFEARSAGSDWRADVGGAACSRPRCPNIAVAAMNRGQLRWHGDHYVRNDAWWRYCATHLADYHKWVEHGRVMSWEPVPPEST